jgi:hypothetical protein
VRKIAHEIKPISATNAICITGGNQCQSIGGLSDVKSLINRITTLWKRKSNKKVRFNSMKPKPATAKTDKIFLTIGFLNIEILINFYLA